MPCLKVLLDIDGTLCDTVNPALRAVEQHFKLEQGALCEGMVYQPDMTMCIASELIEMNVAVTREALNTFLRQTCWDKPSFYEDLRPTPLAFVLADLVRSKADLKLLFCTSRPRAVRDTTIRWLTALGLVDTTTGLLVLLDGLEIGDRYNVARKFSFDLYIDDVDTNLYSAQKARPEAAFFPPSRPWNRAAQQPTWRELIDFSHHSLLETIINAA